jgi:hypothetical protein
LQGLKYNLSQKYIIVETNTSMLQFSGSTKFTPEEYDDGKILRYVFEFVHLIVKFYFWFDVVGVIIDITPIEEMTTTYGKADMMSLYLRNERLNIILIHINC